MQTAPHARGQWALPPSPDDLLAWLPRRGAPPMSSPPPAVLEAARIVGRDWVDAPYYAEAESAMAGQWQGIVLPFLQIGATGIDLAVTLDLAAGHGRNSAMLLPLAGHLHIVDINRPNLEACWRRFGEHPRISYHQTDGASLPVPDASVTFVYCFDAMVHFDSDVVRAYLRDCRRALRPGGHAFLHHSNDSRFPTGDLHDHPHWRNYLSLHLMAHYAAKEGLTVVRQQALDWNHDDSDIDGLTLLRAG